MSDDVPARPLLARCVVCRGDVYAVDRYEVWQGGFYCERHTLSYLRARAREYAELAQSTPPTDPERNPRH